MDYYNVYSRNIGLFSKEQQEKLRKAKIAIAGVGGVGGIQAATLARFGIGEMSLMDPGLFDESDMNRQYGAMKDTLGKNKALVTGEILQKLSPFIKINAYSRVLKTKRQLQGFIEGSSLVIDAIDYAALDHKMMFAEVARENNLYNLSAPIPDFGALLMVFDPHGMTLEEFFGTPRGKEQETQPRVPHQRLYEDRTLARNLKAFLNGKTPYISTNAGAASLAGGLLATEAALIIAGIRRDDDIVKVPYITRVDLLQRRFEIINPLGN